ncbi:MAG: protein kinase [Rudaea sp.]|uniref:serine/threonine-protein kinase n=1 Tax=Rudaea sp. TaxID=2136325 RepID=UPI0039E48954
MTALPHVLEIFSDAVALDGAARDAYLDRACGDDAALRRQVEDLLAVDAVPGALFAQPFALRDRDRSGERIGAWRLDAPIGSGGMGSVYRATRADGAFAKPVAVKLLAFDAGNLRARFLLERRILGNLSHPNIATLLDVGNDANGAPYFVMEYIDGVPITDYAQARGLDARARIELFLPVLDAVQSAHAQLVVHRDIKPGNVLIDAGGAPKLLDFGIAKLLGDAPTTLAATRTGMAPLTPEYASPEQVRGAPLGTPSDIYSLGVLLYELVAGRRPYRIANTSPSAIERTVCESEPARPSAQLEARSLGGNARDLDAVLLKALAKSPAQRYASCAEFSADLRRWLGGEAVIARVPATSERVLRYVRRHRVGVAAASAVGLALGIGLAAALWEAHAAHLQRARAEARADDLRQLGTSLLSEIDEAIKALPGSTPVQHLLVSRVVEHLDRMAGDADGDRRTLLDAARGYVRLGDIQGNSYSQNLGDQKGGLRNLDKAVALLDPLVAAAPDDGEARQTLADALRVRSQIRPEPRAALADIRRALDVRQAHAGDEAALDAGELAARGTAYGLLGDYEALLPDNAAALAAYRAGLALQQKALQRRPGDAALTRGAAVTTMHIADVEAGSDTWQALADVRTAMRMLDALATADRQNPKILETREMLSFRLGDLLDATRDYAGSTAVYAQLREQADAALRDDPRNQRLQAGFVDARRDAQAFEDMADPDLGANTSHARENLDTARRLTEEALDMQQRMLREDPEDAFHAMGLCELQMRLARIRHRLHLAPAANAQPRDYVATLERLATKPDATGDVVNDAALALIDEASGELRDPKLALQFAQRAAAMTHNQVADYLYTLARAWRANGDLERGHAAARDALKLLAPRQPDQSETRLQKLLDLELGA